VRQGTEGKLGWESGTYGKTLKKVERLFLTVSVNKKAGIPFLFLIPKSRDCVDTIPELKKTGFRDCHPYSRQHSNNRIKAKVGNSFPFERAESLYLYDDQQSTAHLGLIEVK
jgi:hypothetical protein